MNSVDVTAAAAAAAVMEECAGRGGPGLPSDPGERRERVLLRPWLENLIESGLIPGLEWIDAGKTMFKVPWKHRSKKNWSLRHSSVFLEWAKNTGRWKEGDAEPNYAQLKTRLRCAFNKAPDIDEIKELHCTKSEEPYKVYRFTERRDGKSRPLVRMFITRSSRPQAPRRRRRAKNTVRGCSSLPDTSSSVSVASAAAAMACCRVEDFKQEPAPVEVGNYYYNCSMKMEPLAHVVPRTYAGQYREHHTLPLVVSNYNGHCYRLTDTQTSSRILPPPEVDGMPSASKWSPPFPVCCEQLATCMDLSSSRGTSTELYSQAAIPLELYRSHATSDERHMILPEQEGDVCQSSYEKKLASPVMTDASSAVSGRDPVSTILPPLLPVSSASEESHSSHVDAKPVSCTDDDDNSVPPIVRFKNRYRRALQLEQEQQQQEQCGGMQDLNDRETSCDAITSHSLVVSTNRTCCDDSVSDTLSVTDRRAVDEEARPSEKRRWSRITPEVDVSDDWISSSKIPCHDSSVDGDVRQQSMHTEMVRLPQHCQQPEQKSPQYQNNLVNCSEAKFNPDGRPNTRGAAEMLFQESAVPVSSAVNMSQRAVDVSSDSGSDDVEAVDLSTKSSPPVYTAAAAVTDRRSDGDPRTLPYEYVAAGPWRQGVDCPASSCGSGLSMVDVARVEADFQHKSELIETKSAVLLDKERELRLLEQQLASREQTISWHERQLSTANTLKRAAVTGLPVQLDSHWQNVEKWNQQNMAYRDQLTAQGAHAAHRRSLPGFDQLQCVRLHDGGVPVKSSGGAVDKLEEQFARLARPQPSDVRTQNGFQDGLERPPRADKIPIHPVSSGHYRNGPVPEFTATAVRRRGRPRGSKNRCKTFPSERSSAVSNLPIREQWMHNLYMRAQMLRTNPVALTTANEHCMAQQVPVNCRPLVSAGMPGSTPGMMNMIAGVQMLAKDRLSGSCVGLPQSVAAPGLMPARVQQLLSSAAFTTGASILPPLSPVPTEEFSGPSEDSQSPKEAFWCDGGRDPNSNVTRRPENSLICSDPSSVSGLMAASSAQAMRMKSSPRFHEFHPLQHFSNEANTNVRMAENRSNGNATEVQCRWKDDVNHILPKVSSFDASRSWFSVEASQRERRLSNYMSAGRDISLDDDDDDDDSDNRLVVVIDGD